MASALRMAIVEDDATYRTSLEQLFSYSRNFQLVDSYESPPAAIGKAKQWMSDAGTVPWDVIVMDLEMPEMNVVEATRRLKAIAPELKVVVLTVFEEPTAILEAVCAGADGYLLKKARARELIDGIQAVAEGESPLTSNVARKVLDLLRALGAPASGGQPVGRLDLTGREQDVLRALVDGLSYKQAADHLGISLGTVRSHITSIYRKLQVHNVAEAVSRALRQRLV